MVNTGAFASVAIAVSVCNALRATGHVGIAVVLVQADAGAGGAAGLADGVCAARIRLAGIGRRQLLDDAAAEGIASVARKASADEITVDDIT